ncbi:MAG: hypothetical protein J6V28_02930 [Tidjanibacter sp.]|nr:hypothetical protein [Tidjanibacter sp.]
MKKIFLLVLISIAFSSCTTVYFINNKPYFHTAKTSLETKEVSVENNAWSDEYISVNLLQMNEDGIFLRVHNKCNSTLSLLWDKSALVDSGGLAHEIYNGWSVTALSANSINSGLHSSSISMVNWEQNSTCRIIPENSYIEFTISTSDILTTKHTSDEFVTAEEAEKTMEKWNSKNTPTKLLLPIDCGGHVIEYTLSFANSYSTSSEETVNIPLVLPIGIIVLLSIICSSAI